MLVNTYQLKMVFIFFPIWAFAQSVQAQLWTLQQCIDTAQVYNKNLHIQRNYVEIGGQKQLEAKGNLLPKLNVNADYRYFTNLPYQLMPMSVFGGPQGKYKETQFGVPHNINAHLQFAMPLYNPQIKGAIQSAEIATELSNLQLKKTEEQIYFEISNLYYNAQILIHQIQFIDSNLANTQKLLRNMQLLKAQLMATGTDVNKVVLQAGQLKMQREIISSKLYQVMQALKFLMGIPAEEMIAIIPEINDKVIGDYNKKYIIDLQITATQNRLLKNDLSNLKKSALPAIALFGTYGTNGFGYDKRPDNFLKFHPIGFAGIQFAYSLFDGNILKRKRNQKEIELKNNELQLELIAGQNDMQIGNAMNQKKVAQNSMSLNQSQIEQAQSIYEQTIIQQKQGVANLNDVLMADHALREVQQNYLSLLVDYLKADLELKKLTGNLSITN
ncbi:TolC family protein [Agriterribacter sp.]|uniref:TolC family protein n=1 Tax=Agriterribacter sp. TaxID=2821509 RepID=UPI002BAFEFA2|nr:TolC family protein [Agriterribacter sp.]HTN09252.1 TolC family protein [Agriterribacter sp.]